MDVFAFIYKMQLMIIDKFSSDKDILVNVEKLHMLKYMKTGFCYFFVSHVKRN